MQASHFSSEHPPIVVPARPTRFSTEKGGIKQEQSAPPPTPFPPAPPAPPAPPPLCLALLSAPSQEKHKASLVREHSDQCGAASHGGPLQLSHGGVRSHTALSRARADHSAPTDLQRTPLDLGTVQKNNTQERRAHTNTHKEAQKMVIQHRHAGKTINSPVTVVINV